MEIKYFDTNERYGWYFKINETWYYGGSSEEKCRNVALNYEKYYNE